MDEIDRIVEEILGSRRVRESATFSSRSYGSQPIIQTGKQYRESLRNREAAQLTPPTRPTPPMSQQRPSVQPTSTTAPIPTSSAPRRVAPQRPAPAQTPPVPARYYELQRLAQSQGSVGSTSMQGMLAYGTRSASRLFYEQARLMEDFEDDYAFGGTFFQYYPTYNAMTLTQLRGYFSWRTRVRAGTVEPAPTSFAFLYVYELLMGIGTTPGTKGYEDLKAFRTAFRQVIEGSTSSFLNYTRLWLRDYAVYHELDTALARGVADDLPLAVYTLLRAEKAALAKAGLTRREEARSPVPDTAPTDAELFAALDRCARYQIGSSRLRHDHADELHEVCGEVFRALCVHCRRRRKTDYVEGLFGSPREEFYPMFSSAIFYDPQPHANVTVALSPVESFVCQDDRWRHRLLCDTSGQSRERGAVMRATDQRLRSALDFAYPLKERSVQAYVGKIIDQAIKDVLERRKQEEARRITIDLSRLSSIRAAAATTQEALLTDEERGDVERVSFENVGQNVSFGAEAGLFAASGPTATPESAAAPMPAATSEPAAAPVSTTAPMPAASSPDVASVQQTSFATTPQPSPSAGPTIVSGGSAVMEDNGTPSSDGSSTNEVSAANLGLSDAELRVLQALLANSEPASALTPADPMLSLVVDAINDKLFDLVGDAVIEYEDDVPALIEDYLPDVKEALGL